MTKKKRNKKKLDLTFNYLKHEDGYTGAVNEIREVWAEGETLEELRENLIDALHGMIQAKKDLPKCYGS